MAFSRFIDKGKWFIQNFQRLRDFSAKHYYEETEQKKVIKKSSYFDESYYRRNNPELSDCKDLAEHYLLEGGLNGKDPSEFFSSEEYLTIHADVAISDFNPLLQYELYGRKADYEISTLQLSEDGLFPDDTDSFERTYSQNSAVHKRTAVVSCFFSDGKIPETLLILLRGIREIADNIILVGDCPVFKSELDKLDGLVCYAKFERHHQYDFGSYKSGMLYARKIGLLVPELTDELIFVNDSCFGPIYPIDISFRSMEDVPCDFWGFTGYKHGYYHPFKSHISSYFLVFRRPVIDSGCLDDFLNRIHGKYERGKVIVLLETELTFFIQKRGFLGQTLCKNLSIDNFIHPLTIVKNYKIPFVKKKAFIKYSEDQSDEDLCELLDHIRENNPELAQFITIKQGVPRTFTIPSVKEHQAAMPSKVKRIIEKTRRGNSLKVLFLTMSYSVFPAKLLFKKMLNDPNFDVSITIIPDLRQHDDALTQILFQEKLLLKDGISEDRLLRVRPDELFCWPDVCEEMDIVCYCTPHSYSSFRYHPKYASGRSFLPIMVENGIPCSTYADKVLGFDAYQYMWKVFFPCDEIVKQYLSCRVDVNDNAEAIGLIHMDELPELIMKKDMEKKVVLITLKIPNRNKPDGSIDVEKINRYIEYFSGLPDQYPMIDFIFRLHPNLLTSLKEHPAWGSVAVDVFIMQFCAKSNVIWDDIDDCLKAFAESDACIMDDDSLLGAYQYLMQPCCFLLESKSHIASGFTPYGRMMLEICETVEDFCEVNKFIENVIIYHHDEKVDCRKTFCEKIMVNYPYAADAALHSIKQSLGINDR